MMMGIFTLLKSSTQDRADISASIKRVRRRGDDFNEKGKSSERGNSQKNSDDGTNSTCLNSEIYSDYSSIPPSKSDEAVEFGSGEVPLRNCNIDSVFRVPNTISIPVCTGGNYCEERQEFSAESSNNSFQSESRDDSLSPKSAPFNISASKKYDSSNPALERIAPVLSSSLRPRTKALPLKDIRRSSSEKSKLYVHVYHNKLLDIQEEGNEISDRSEYDFDENEMKERWLFTLKLMKHMSVKTEFSTKVSSEQSEVIQKMTTPNGRDDVER